MPLSEMGDTPFDLHGEVIMAHLHGACSYLYTVMAVTVI